MQVPTVYFRGSLTNNQNENTGTNGQRPQLLSRIMRDFVGLAQVDALTTQALLDFSYQLAVADMDKAYSAVRLIKEASVWENMAHMCIKTKRLDVGEICLKNMGYARGAAAVRGVKESEAELESSIAQVTAEVRWRVGRQELLTYASISSCYSSGGSTARSAGRCCAAVFRVWALRSPGAALQVRRIVGEGCGRR